MAPRLAPRRPISSCSTSCRRRRTRRTSSPRRSSSSRGRGGGGRGGQGGRTRWEGRGRPGSGLDSVFLNTFLRRRKILAFVTNVVQLVRVPDAAEAAEGGAAGVRIGCGGQDGRRRQGKQQGRLHVLAAQARQLSRRADDLFIMSGRGFLFVR